MKRIEAESAGKNNRIEAKVDIYRKDSAICNITKAGYFYDHLEFWDGSIFRDDFEMCNKISALLT